MSDPITIRNLHETRRHLAQAGDPIVFLVEEGNAAFCGRVIDDTFGYRVGVQQANVAGMIRDFTRYESGQGRTPLVFVFEGISIPSPVRGNVQDDWLVHATDTEAGASILRTRRLCSRSHLRANGTAFRSFGRENLDEPADYSDLVNFAPLNQPGAEVVVASKQHERFCSETDAYTPGVRFYLSVRRLMSLPQYVAFLGGHAVRGSAELDEVGHAVVIASELNADMAWTPMAFTEAADALFEKRICDQRDRAARTTPHQPQRGT
ncbi:MAG: hypothetical protein HQ582_16340 [Planctomycetes bacterium]|nr:hypothetical protein [Planctomycetota bacterium]